MKWKSLSRIQISGLNQEKLLNQISKQVQLFDIDRNNKNQTSFSCSFFDCKKVLKMLKNKNVKVVNVHHQGVVYNVLKGMRSYGLILAIVLFFGLYFLQNNMILQYEILGVDKLSKDEIVCFIKENFSSNINNFDTSKVEVELSKKFDEISFVSCMVKGQTLLINIKEKLLPEEMYGDFQPITASKDGKITQINLVSGTLKVSVGDLVQKGDVLVEPYVFDTSGNLKKVEAKAEIFADIYNIGSVDHCEKVVEVVRTGNVAVMNQIVLFGLEIYSFKEAFDFDMYEVEYEERGLVKNLPLPFKTRKTMVYELKERVVETKFEDVKEEYVEKAKQKAFAKCQNSDIIKEEFYTLRHLSGITIVNYCIITEEMIGEIGG